MIIKDQALEKFETIMAKDLIMFHMGEQGRCYANDFVVTDFFYNKYKTLVLNNKQFIKDKHLLDVGSSMGQWSLLSHLNGAKSVTCLEPRQQYVEGLNKFSAKHKIDLQAIQGIHSDIFKWGRKFDVVMLSCVLTSVPDIFSFFHRLRDITKHVIIKSESLKDIPADTCKMTKTYNTTHRASVDLRSDGYLKEWSGKQLSISDWGEERVNGEGATFCWWYGIDYLLELFEYFNYKVVKVEKQPDDRDEETKNLDSNRHYHDIVLEVL
jgi:hypothetical protein